MGIITYKGYDSEGNIRSEYTKEIKKDRRYVDGQGKGKEDGKGTRSSRKTGRGAK